MLMRDRHKRAVKCFLPRTAKYFYATNSVWTEFRQWHELRASAAGASPPVSRSCVPRRVVRGVAVGPLPRNSCQRASERCVSRNGYWNATNPIGPASRPDHAADHPGEKPKADRSPETKSRLPNEGTSRQSQPDVLLPQPQLLSRIPAKPEKALAGRQSCVHVLEDLVSNEETSDGAPEKFRHRYPLPSNRAAQASLEGAEIASHSCTRIPVFPRRSTRSGPSSSGTNLVPTARRPAGSGRRRESATPSGTT